MKRKGGGTGLSKKGKTIKGTLWFLVKSAATEVELKQAFDDLLDLLNVSKAKFWDAKNTEMFLKKYYQASKPKIYIYLIMHSFVMNVQY